MTPQLTPAGYDQTLSKLAELKQRLNRLDRRQDLDPQHHAEVRQSYLRMISQYRREIKLYEAKRDDENKSGLLNSPSSD